MRARLNQLVRDVVRDHRAEAIDLHQAFPIRAGDIVMLGDSLTAGGDWSGAFPGLPVRNRGVNGEVSAQTSERLGEITDGVPATIFLMIGTNDLSAGVELPKLATNIASLIDRIEKQSPATRLILQSLLPRSDRLNGKVGEANLGLRRVAADRNVTFLDLHHDFADHRGRLHPTLAVDGVHLNGAGYALWVNRLRPMMQYPVAALDVDASRDQLDANSTSTASPATPTNGSSDESQGIIVDLRPVSETSTAETSTAETSTADANTAEASSTDS